MLDWLVSSHTKIWEYGRRKVMHLAAFVSDEEQNSFFYYKDRHLATNDIKER